MQRRILLDHTQILIDGSYAHLFLKRGGTQQLLPPRWLTRPRGSRGRIYQLATFADPLKMSDRAQTTSACTAETANKLVTQEVLWLWIGG